MRRKLLAAVLVLGVVGAVLSWQWYGPRRVTVSAGKFPEELVYVRSSDDIINGGAIFAPPKALAKPIAVLWVHGWSANFYSPTYVMVARALAERGLTALTLNTRMHDIGTNAGERGGKRIRGGGYWGVTSEDAHDIAAWIDFAEDRGFKRVVLVGHSAGWASVAAYQAAKQDPRVVGMVLASGSVVPPPPPPNAELLAQAARLVADGKGDDLLPLPNRSFPSFVSAATFLDIAKTPPVLSDFFGLQTQNAGITRIQCPPLAFYGTRGDVGGEGELEKIRSSIARHASGPRRVDTRMIQRGDHMYTGEEAQVATAIAEWANRL
jgi:pimeloyl-ACP methyl ester carboxylesterase